MILNSGSPPAFFAIFKKHDSNNNQAYNDYQNYNKIVFLEEFVFESRLLVVK